jgi:hypothetical protein
MNLRVVEALDWEAVEKAAAAAHTCIRPGDGPNNALAKEVWESNPGKVRYFVQESRSSTYQWFAIGYVRLHRVSENLNKILPKLWIVDFCAPFNYRAMRLVQQQVSEPVLTHKRVCDDEDLAAHWLTLPLKLSRAADYKFHQCQGSCESGWLVVT